MGFWGRFVEVEGGFAKGLGDRGLGLPIGYIDITGLSRRHNGQVGRDKKNNCSICWNLNGTRTRASRIEQNIR